VNPSQPNDSNTQNPQTVLKQYWGYEKFRPLQEEIVNSVLAGKDTLALLPTGGGKSICFQVPGMIFQGITIVISPLIALMKDQVEQLQKRGIKASAIYSGMSPREIDILLDNCVYGDTKFLYVSPERLKSDLLIARAKLMNVALIVVDEAHCISQWGYDFRPPYLEIAAFREHIPTANIIALTATATPEVKADIISNLELDQPNIFVKSFSRKNISYSIRYTDYKEKKMLEILQKVNGSALVYVRNRGKTQHVAEYLNKYGIVADYYHAGLANVERDKKQNAWIKNKTRVIVATNAFGMGIDKPDVRCVIHLDLPDSLEAYYQEAGRAGRDEKLAFAVLLHHQTDADELLQKTKLAYPSIDYIKRVYQALANYFRIAIESSFMVSYDFEIEEFSKNYNFNLFEVFGAIKRLEDSALIQLNESFYKPSKIFIPVDHKELYKYQVANVELDPLIKGILRIYGGEAFTTYVNFSESNIQKLTGIPTADIKNKLRYLNKARIILYDEQTEKPQLTFLTPRQDALKLQIDIKKLEKRKAIVLGKIDKMISYATNKMVCRTQLFQQYFGEYSYVNCGNCDVCISRKKEIRDAVSKSDLEKLVLTQLTGNPISLKELRIKCNFNDDFVLVEMLRELLESEKIQINELGEIALHQ
jgi:ATP-dependent DNA helicase RecQ